MPNFFNILRLVLYSRARRALSFVLSAFSTLSEMGSEASLSPTTRELADQTATHARHLEQNIAFNGHCNYNRGDSRREETMQKTRAAIIDGCRAMMDLVVEPEEKLKNMAMEVESPCAVHSSPVTQIEEVSRTSTTSSPWISSIATQSSLKPLRRANLLRRPLPMLSSSSRHPYARPAPSHDLRCLLRATRRLSRSH